MTILFSDIRGSTSYFEKNGDVAGLAMIERHNNLLFPCIEDNAGRVIKTIGDSIMASFKDPVDAIKASVRMQRVLEQDNAGREEAEQIHIRIGVHTGLGLEQGDDVFGDVVNAAARIQKLSEIDQIVITDSLLSAAEIAGFQAGMLGRAEIRGKAEQIDIYAMGWSPRTTQQLIDDVQERFGQQVRDLQRSKAEMEETFDQSRVEWGEERRKFNAEIEQLEEDATSVAEAARERIREEFRLRMESKIEAGERARTQIEAKLDDAQDRAEVERKGYRDQIASLESRLVEAMEEINNPARVTGQVREQVEAKLSKAKQRWTAQWESERERLIAEIESLRNPGRKRDPVAEARRLTMERIKAAQQGGVPAGQVQTSREDLEKEKDKLQLEVNRLQEAFEDEKENARTEIYNQLKHTYDQKMEQVLLARSQLEHEVRNMTEELAAEKRAAAARIRELEETVQEAEESARFRATEDARAEQDERVQKAERSASRVERRHREELERWNLERVRLEHRIEELESNLAQAQDMAMKRSSEPTIEELNRLRRQLEQEFQAKSAALESENRKLAQRLEPADGPQGDS